MPLGTEKRSLIPLVVLVLVAFLGVFCLSGCLVSFGTPLARKVEPNRWILEAGGGLGTTDPRAEAISWGGYAYVGRGLGEHFEIGILPYYYTFNGDQVGALCVPVKWDPFNYDKPLHVTFFAGPVLYTFSETMGLDAAGTIGTGVSGYSGDVVELYGSLSYFVYLPEFEVDANLELGSRFHITERFSLGVGAMANGLWACLGVTVGTVLGKK